MPNPAYSRARLSFRALVVIALGLTIGLIGLLGVRGLRAFGQALDFAPKTVTDPAQYHAIRGSLGAASAHFPDTIPASARSTEMVYFPGFLQGSARLELKYRVDPDEAAALAGSLSAAHPANTLTTECSRLMYIELLSVAGAPIRTLKSLAVTHLVFILHDSGDWHHPNIGGVLVNPDAGEVLYFAVWG